ncbi:MAG: FtsX-like permease family protein [Acidobacteriota bacterium]
MFYLKLAWRNILRNKRRTIIASIAIGVGLASLIVTDGFMIGMKNNLVDSATSTLLGEAQIHHKDFRQSFDVEKTILNKEEVFANLMKDPDVETFSERVISLGMITSPSTAESVIVYGIDPMNDKNLSKIDNRIDRGTYFEESIGREIVIGSKLAEVLEVSLGDRIVITVAQAFGGDLSQEMFRVSGIYHFNVKEMDNGMVFIRKEKAQKMLNLEDKIHEIAVKFTNIRSAEDKKIPFWNKFGSDGNEAVSWTIIMAELKNILDMTDISLYMMGGILFFVVIFGIINSLFMSLYERMFEFGILKAVGTRPSGLRKLILFEAGWLAIVSIFIGVLIGFAGSLLLLKYGINYGGIELSGAYIHEKIYPVMNLMQYIKYPVFVLIFTIVVGLYPAYVAGKMKVTDALRKSM